MANFKFSWTPKEVSLIHTTHRQIQTKLPVPESLSILETLSKFESRSMHGQMPIVWHQAKDYQVSDKWGNTWIDFTSTIFVANTGHANEKIKTALINIINQDLIHTYNYPTEVRAAFLKKLMEITPPYFEKAYLMSAGTEATECLIKLMRLNGQRTNKAKPGIVSFLGAYHGRTMGAALIGGTPDSQKWVGFHDPNIHQIPFPYSWDLDNKNGSKLFYEHVTMLEHKGVNWKTDICGFILESYIGWAASFIPLDYIQTLSNFARAHNILLGFDEIQGGFGRTGELFVYQHYGVKPDLIACGKGISSSLPLSAVLGRKEVMDLPDIGSMSSTHSANPLSCAAGLANIEELFEKKLIDEARRKGEILNKHLTKLQEESQGYISHIICKGLLAAIIFQDPHTHEPLSLLPSLVCEKAMQSGLLLVHTGRESIKIAPPLTIPDDALIEGLSVLSDCVLSMIAEAEIKNAS